MSEKNYVDLTRPLGDEDAAAFEDTAYEKDYHAAGNIYEQIDPRIQSRGQRHSETDINKKLAQYGEEKPTVRH